VNDAVGPRGYWCRFCRKYQSTRNATEAKIAREHHEFHITARHEVLPVAITSNFPSTT
jgi:hypothetical protein